jgi:predicted dehydrogenase
MPTPRPGGQCRTLSIRHLYTSLEDLADLGSGVVDIATFRNNAAIIHQAIEAGKHILSQKPLALGRRRRKK